jgi:hypothetical protein
MRVTVQPLIDQERLLQQEMPTLPFQPDETKSQNHSTEEDLPFKLNLKTDGSAVMQNKQSTLGLLNLASDQ